MIASPEKPVEPAPAQPAPGSRALFNRYFGALTAIILSASVLTTLVYLAGLARFPIDLDYPEGAVVSRAMDLAQGGAVYRDWREWPHPLSPYGPLTYHIPGRLAQALDSPVPRTLYLLGRGQSIAALALGLFCVCGFCRRLGLPMHWALFALAPALAWNKLTSFAVSYRPDMPAVAFSLLAFWIALGGPPTRRRAMASFSALWIAFWFKPIGFAMGLTLAVWVSLPSFGLDGGSAQEAAGPPRWRRGVLAMIMFALSGLSVAALINHFSDGMFFLNLRAAVNNGYSLQNLRIVLFEGTVGLSGALMLLGLAAAALRSLRGRVTDPEGLWALATCLSFAAALPQGSKFGANSNYLLEFYLLASVGVTTQIHRAWRALITRPATLQPRLLALVPAALMFGWLMLDASTGLMSAAPDLKIILNAHKYPPKMARAMVGISGQVLVQRPDLALARPAPPTLMDSAHYMVALEQMPDAGAAPLAESPLLRKIEAREFAVIVLSKNHYMDAIAGRGMKHWAIFDPVIMDAIQANYALQGQADGFVFLLPNVEDPITRNSKS